MTKTRSFCRVLFTASVLGATALLGACGSGPTTQTTERTTTTTVAPPPPGTAMMTAPAGSTTTTTRTQTQTP
jgi:hypothetical protein